MDIGTLTIGFREDVREALVENGTPQDQVDAQIARMSPRRLLDTYLEWNGIIGYTSDIISAIRCLEKASGGDVQEW